MTGPEHIARYAELSLALEPELGRCSAPVHRILSLAPGSVLKLARAIGSDVDVSVGGAPFGTAELVKIGKTLSLRMTAFQHNTAKKAE